jgi:hypothetical protein
LYIIYGLFVSTIIIALIIKVVRKKVILNKPAPVPPYPYKPKTAPKPTSSYNKEDDDQKTLLPKYCPFCGEHMDRDAIFCHQCGNRL